MEKVSGIILLVDNIRQSVAFYEKLDFRLIKEVPDTAITVGIDGFWIELLHKNKVVTEEYKEDAQKTDKGAGAYLQIRVEEVDAFYETVTNNGITEAPQPVNYPWNQREFTITDPDGYKITFFSPL